MGNRVVSAMKTVYVGLVLLLAATASAKPQLPSLSGIKNFLRRCKMPNDGTCAILYDDEGCDGWELKVNEGYTALPKKSKTSTFTLGLIDGPKENDAESVLVRKGCVFVGYEYDGKKDQSFGEDGFEDLDEEISAVECRCNDFEFSKRN